MIKKKDGFSLVEIITVVTIISILFLVLTPTLIAYVEKMRAARDASAMSEVANAIRLSTSNQDIYDELTSMSLTDNVSCYIDNKYENTYEEIVTKYDDNKNIEQYTYGEYARLADEKAYFAAGKMRGVTITFVVNDQTEEDPYVVDFSKAVINKFTDNPKPLKDFVGLYNAIKQVMSKDVKLMSQTYRASEYTVFVKIGTFGGNQANAQDAVQVYGQFSGTNLHTDVEYEIAERAPTT